MSLKTVYLASPYSHRLKKVMREREKEINRVAAELTYKYGYMMFLPITQSAPLERIIPALGGSFEKWKEIDLKAVSMMDELWVVLLDGWDISVGVTEEIRYAKELGKRVRYIDPQNIQFVTSKEVELLSKA
jgi:hypothetical protein